MLKYEAEADGFSISIEGRTILVHTPKAPLVELGRAELSVRAVKGGFHPRMRGYAPVRLREHSLVSGSETEIVVDFGGKLRMTVRARGAVAELSFAGAAAEINVWKLRLPARADEHLYGLGERRGRIDLKGTRAALWVGEATKGTGPDPAWMPPKHRDCAGLSLRAACLPIPSFVSSAGYFVRVETGARCVFDFRKGPRTFVECWGIPDSVTIGLGRNAPETVAALGASAGRQDGLPAWPYAGAWLALHGGTDAVLRRLQSAMDAGAKVSAVYVPDWCGRRETRAGFRPAWNWRYDEASYPDLPGTVASLAKAGVRFIGYVNPFLSVDGDLYREASAKRFLVRNPEGEEYLANVPTAPAALVDLANPDAYAWLRGIVAANMAGIGMGGWLADSGECLPPDAVLPSGATGMEAHNVYPVLWARLNAEAAEAAGATDAVYCLRSGWAGSARHARAFWSGDRTTDMDRDDGIASVVPSALSLGFSGGGITHSPIGGSVAARGRRRSRETFMRWAELETFSPIMRTDETTKPDRAHQFWTDEATLRHFVRCTEIHAALAPYHRHVMDEYASTGVPPVRHTFLHYERDDEAHRQERQYLYGRDLLVAPVCLPGKDLHDLYLPDDTWVHLWSSRVFRGGYTTVEAPLGYPPVFYREASQFASVFDSLRRNIRKV